MSLIDDRPTTSPPRRGRRVLVNVAWLGLGVILTWGLLANPLGLSGLDALRHRLLGDHPAADSVGAHPAGAHQWTCPMHPEIVEDEPGSCPICHMDLVPMEAEESEGGDAGAVDGHQLWTCGMHPDVIQDEPGSCPICHMDLVPLRQETAPTPAASGPREVLFYRNPMDPTITSPVPAKDEMGMDYVPVYSDEVGDAARGGATVTIDPTVVQNMNVLTAVAERGELAREIRTVGYLEYDQQKMVSVTTKYPGWIEKVFVNYVGEPVRKGQPLFEIYSPELVQTEQDLLSAIEFARRMAGATGGRPPARPGSGRGLAPETRRTGTSPTSRSRKLEETGKVFRTLTVVAPAGGVVMQRMPGPRRHGGQARHGALPHRRPVLALAVGGGLRGPDPLAPGWQRCRGEPLATSPVRRSRGRVRFIEPQVNEATRTVPLKLEVPNRGGRLRAGMYATVRFQPVVAEDAVRRAGAGGPADRPAEPRGRGRGRGPLRTPRGDAWEPRADGRVEILVGLEPGEKVVTSAQFLIDSESNLREAIQKLLAARSASAESPRAADHQH